MADIIDFKSGKRYVDLSKLNNNKQENDRTIEEKIGRYIGVLPKHEAIVMRDLHEQLSVKKSQIDALTQEFNTMWEGASYNTSGALMFLGVDEYDPELQVLYVDKEGHCWLVNADEPEAQAFIERKEGHGL
jgi:hypothetical protein